MRFAFTDDQLLFRDAVRDLLESQCGPNAVRAAWEGGPTVDLGLWKRLGEMGVLGILAPEAAGGLGLTEIELVLLLEETGRAAMPGPVVEHAAVAVPLLAAAGQEEWLARAAAGAAVVSVALGSEGDGAGGSPAVPWADEADLVLVERGGRLHAVSRDAATVVAGRESIDRSRPAAVVDVTGAPVLAVPEAARTGAVADGFDRGALGAAAQLIGLGAHLLDVTVEYAKQRHQFGVPIGSYQAVKHHLANACLGLAYARPAVHRAAWSMANRVDARSRDVSMAKAYANEAAAFTARVALQCHGAIGYTYEHDLHLWMKRVWALAPAWGDTAFHRGRVAGALGL